MIAPARPALRYHGGKWLLAPWILSHLPPHRGYVEPYAGAASVLLRKPRSHSECYNDLDGEVVNVFRVLQSPRRAAQLRRMVALTAYARAEYADAFAPSDHPVIRAHRAIVRSLMGFGSAAINAKYLTGFRAQSRQSGTTPALDWSHWPDAVPAYVERLRGVCIESRPALEVIAQQDAPDVLFYVDPPYLHSTRGNNVGVRQKYTVEMSDDDHRALAASLRAARGMVVLSGYPSDLYDRDLFADWHRVARGALADGARERTEVLWLNAAAVAAMPTQQLIEATA